MHILLYIMNQMRFVSCSLMGGLGNQLFQLFTTIAYSIRYNIVFILPYVVNLDGKRHTYWDSFLIDLLSNTTFHKQWKLNNNHLSTIPTYKENTFHYIEIPKADISFRMHGYFQSYKYFIKEADIIFQMIRLREQQNIIRAEAEFMDIFPKDKNTILISLHFRIGDYVNLQDFHPILTLNYYRKSLDYILSFLPSNKIRVLYFCEKVDNEVVVKHIEVLQHIYKEENIEFIKVSDDIVDWKQLLLMSLCHHNIIANSTFSWWGAFFNGNVDKKICYPSNWFGVKYAHYNIMDLFPSEWKKMEC